MLDSQDAAEAHWTGSCALAKLRGNGSVVVVRTEWWLMDAALPDLTWARLTVRSDGSSEVADAGGELEFETEEEALVHLSEDEFRLFDPYLVADASEDGHDLSGVEPPDDW